MCVCMCAPLDFACLGLVPEVLHGFREIFTLQRLWEYGFRASSAFLHIGVGRLGRQSHSAFRTFYCGYLWGKFYRLLGDGFGWPVTYMT